jgi:Zn-dependent protease
VDGRLAETGKILVLYMVTTLLSLTVHEYSHARVADFLGDATPRRQGRLTLSPLAHIDPLGTLVIPIVAILAGGVPFLAWARPVQTNPQNYTRKMSMRNGHRLVAAAGPLSNLVFAAVAMGALSALIHTGVGFSLHAGTASALAMLLLALVRVNIGLCVFNFLPIPPLDGSRLLPRSMDDFQRAIAPYSFFILMILASARPLRGMFFLPVEMIAAALETLFGFPVGFA